MERVDFFVIFELLGFFAFIVILGREIFQRNRLKVFEIISCAVFGMILEIGNTFLAHTYSYGPDFSIKILNIPLVIGLYWSTVVYSVMLLSDQYNIPWKLKPFMDALTAVIIDLTLDVVAIRLGFWKWALPETQEWFGIPYANLVGWILIVFVFSFIIRFIRTLNPKRIMTDALMLLAPIFSYLGLLIGLGIFSFFTVFPYQINNWTNRLDFNYKPDLAIINNPQVQFWSQIVFVVIMVELVNVVIWSVVKYKKKFTGHFDLLSFFFLSFSHMFSIVALLVSGIYKELPFFVFFGILMFVAYLLLHFLPFLLRPANVYVFRKIEKVIEKDERKIEKIIDKSFR